MDYHCLYASSFPALLQMLIRSSYTYNEPSFDLPNSDLKVIKIIANYRRNVATICNIYDYLWENQVFDATK